jgi:hypothetical protein
MSASQHGGQFFFSFTVMVFGVWCLVVRGPVFLYIPLSRTVTTGDQYVGTSLLVTVLTWSGGGVKVRPKT